MLKAERVGKEFFDQSVMRDLLFELSSNEAGFVWSLAIDSASEPMLCGISLTGPDYFCCGWGEVEEIFNFDEVFFLDIDFDLFFRVCFGEFIYINKTVAVWK